MTDNTITSKKDIEFISKEKFKSKFFYLVLGAKIIVILFLSLLWSTGSFTNEQYVNTLGILIPMFATILTVMIADISKESTKIDKGEIKKSIQKLAFIMIGLYTITLLSILNLRGPGTISMTQMTTMIMLVETSLGVYLGKIVYALFKNID